MYNNIISYLRGLGKDVGIFDLLNLFFYRILLKGTIVLGILVFFLVRDRLGSGDCGRRLGGLRDWSRGGGWSCSLRGEGGGEEWRGGGSLGLLGRRCGLGRE